MPRAEAKTPPPPAKTWVRLVREAAGLTQEEFAARLGTVRETVAKWEEIGGSEPSFKYSQKIRALFPQQTAEVDRAGMGPESVGRLPHGYSGATGDPPLPGEGHMPSELAQSIAVLVDRLENDQQKLEALYEVRKVVQKYVSASRPPRAT